MRGSKNGAMVGGKRALAYVVCSLLLSACGNARPDGSPYVAGSTAAAAAAGATPGIGGSAGSITGNAGSAGMQSVVATSGSGGVPSPATAGGGAGGNGGGGAGAQGTAGVMPEAGSSGASAGTGGGGGAVAPRPDLGEGDGRDVITIGDSWMSNTLLTGGAIEGALSRLTSQPYRNYGVQGVLLLQASLFGAAIPSQYDRAKASDPDISTVIMTGGGNDIIQNATVQASCNSGGDACKQKLAEIVAALNALWTKMADDGVKDVVFIRYASDAGSTDSSVRGGGDPPAICLSGKIRCHSIDTTAAVMGELQDGIHPTRAANDRIAKVVHDYMVMNGIRR
jgi:hypothetical protein